MSVVWFAFFFEYFLYAHVVKKIFQTMLCLCLLTRRQPRGGASCAVSLPADQPVPHPLAYSPVKHPDREAGLTLKGD